LRQVAAQADVAVAAEAYAAATLNVTEITTELASKTADGKTADGGDGERREVAPVVSAAVASPEAKDAAKAAGRTMKDSIVKGTGLWKNGKRAECFSTYKAAAEESLAALPAAGTAGWTTAEGDMLAMTRAALEEALTAAEQQTAARGAVTMRKAFDKSMQGLAGILTAVAQEEGPPVAAARPEEDQALAGEVLRLREALVAARQECERMSVEVASKKEVADDTKAEAEADEVKLAESAAADRARIREAQERAAKLEAQLEVAQTAKPSRGSSGKGDAGAARKLNKVEKQLKEEQARARDLEKQLQAGPQ